MATQRSICTKVTVKQFPVALEVQPEAEVHASRKECEPLPVQIEVCPFEQRIRFRPDRKRAASEPVLSGSLWSLLVLLWFSFGTPLLAPDSDPLTLSL